MLDSASWPEERLRKVERSYAMEYVRSLIPEAIDLFGPQDAQWLIGGAARLVGMHFYDECRDMLGVKLPDRIAAWLAELEQRPSIAGHPATSVQERALAGGESQTFGHTPPTLAPPIFSVSKPLASSA